MERDSIEQELKRPAAEMHIVWLCGTGRYGMHRYPVVRSGSFYADPLPLRNVRCSCPDLTFVLLPRSARSCHSLHAGPRPIGPRSCPKWKSPSSGAKGQDTFASLPRALRAWADGVPDGRSHRQASAATDRAGVHPSWHGLIEAGGGALRFEVHIRCPLG